MARTESGVEVEVGPYESKEMKLKRVNRDAYLRYKKYSDILEGGNTKEFFSDIQDIKDAKYKKELINHFEINYRVPLSKGKKQMSVSEEE